MDHVYLGISTSFPAPRNYERIRIDNVNFNDSISSLVEKFRTITKNKETISLAYCGDILDDNEPINRYLIRSGSTVHVLKKAEEDEPKDFKKFTELDVSRVCSMYRSLNSGNFHVRRTFLLLKKR